MQTPLSKEQSETGCEEFQFHVRIRSMGWVAVPVLKGLGTLEKSPLPIKDEDSPILEIPQARNPFS
jgi:hypothetical protein